MKVGTRTLLAVLGGFIAVAMANTGCSASSPDGSSTKSDVPVVKIGVGAPLTAGATALGLGTERAVRLAVAQANASETVEAAGIRFSAVPGDDQGDPKVGVTIAKTFSSDPSFVGVVGHMDSDVSVAASKVYAAKKIVMVSPASHGPSLTKQGFRGVFRVCATDEVQASAAADFATNLLKCKTACVVDDSSKYVKGLASTFVEQFTADGGKMLGDRESLGSKADTASLVADIRAANPDVIYYGGVFDVGALFAKQARAGGVEAPLMGGDGICDPQFIKLAGPGRVEGDLATTVGYPVGDLPAGARFLAAYRKTYPGVEPAIWDGYSYDAANVIINAVVAAAKTVGADKVTGTSGRDEIAKNVAATNMRGVTGPIAFDAQGDTLNKAITLHAVDGGRWTVKALPR